jgi:hypothetical protein
MSSSTGQQSQQVYYEELKDDQKALDAAEILSRLSTNTDSTNVRHFNTDTPQVHIEEYDHRYSNEVTGDCSSLGQSQSQSQSQSHHEEYPAYQGHVQADSPQNTQADGSYTMGHLASSQSTGHPHSSSSRLGGTTLHPRGDHRRSSSVTKSRRSSGSGHHQHRSLSWGGRRLSGAYGKRTMRDDARRLASTYSQEQQAVQKTCGPKYAADDESEGSDDQMETEQRVTGTRRQSSTIPQGMGFAETDVDRTLP